MALRARSRLIASMRSARANSTITMAASGHSPRAMAPVTATLMRALMFMSPFLRLIQPLR